MTENTESTYNGGGLKGPLYWLAGVVTGKLALNAIQGGSLLGGGMSNTAAQAANAAVQYELAKKDSEIALLKADQNTDKKLVEVYTELRKQDKTQDAVMAGLATRISAIETAAPQREEIAELKSKLAIDRAVTPLRESIAAVSNMASTGIATLNTSVAGLAATVASVTKTVIPNTSVCPGWGNVTITPQGSFVYPPPPPAPVPTPAVSGPVAA